MIDRPRTSWYGPAALRASRVPPRAALLALATLAASCGPIEYMNQVGSKAANAVAAAKQAGAERYAPYEYTAAELYLHKAREEAGYAEYQDAIDYGRKSEELANRARAICTARQSQGGASETARPRRE